MPHSSASTDSTNTHIEPSRWGKDHWSCLLFLETVIVDHRGVFSDKLRMSMRTNPDTHPTYGYWRHERHQWRPEWGTRVAYSPTGTTVITLEAHDDWDCLEDMEAAGLLLNQGSAMNPVLRLTDRGVRVAGMVRTHRADGKRLVDFRLLPETWDGIVKAYDQAERRV